MEKKINVLSLFDGISCGQIALHRVKHQQFQDVEQSQNSMFGLEKKHIKKLVQLRLKGFRHFQIIIRNLELIRLVIHMRLKKLIDLNLLGMGGQ